MPVGRCSRAPSTDGSPSTRSCPAPPRQSAARRRGSQLRVRPMPFDLRGPARRLLWLAAAVSTSAYAARTELPVVIGAQPPQPDAVLEARAATGRRTHRDHPVVSALRPSLRRVAPRGPPAGEGGPELPGGDAAHLRSVRRAARAPVAGHAAAHDGPPRLARGRGALGPG